jgi:excisionase family DNA binding protein
MTGHSYTRQAVSKAISEGRLTAYRIGEQMVVSEDALVQYLKKWGKWKARI